MPEFSFSVVKKETKVAKHKKSVENRLSILEKDKQGVIFIDIEGNYSVKVNNKFYNINPKNYNTQDVETIYLQRLSKDGHREAYVRSLDFAPKVDEKHYLPFTVGCEVDGNIVKNNLTNNIYFDIKNVIMHSSDPDSKAAIKFYKENYETIQNNRGLRWINE